MTVEEIARDVVGALDTDASWLTAAKWVGQRYRQLCSRTRFRHLRQIGELHYPAPITGGTVTTNRDSATITPDATALALWSPAIVGRHIRVSIAWYEIVAFDEHTGAITLKSQYGEDSVTGGAYTILTQRFNLDPTVRWIGDFVHARRRTAPLRRISIMELNALAPSRERLGPGFEYVVETESNPDGTKRVELYPYSATSEQVFYVYWKIPPTLGFKDLIDPNIPDNVLREGALIDLYRYEMARAATKGDVNASGIWRNEMRAQMTSWERNILEAIRADRGEDDATFILRRAGLAPRSFDITNAYDEVLARWPR